MPSPLTQLPNFAPNFTSRRIFYGAEPELMDELFALRYQIYCQECEFLPAKKYPEQREFDAYDALAVHFGAFNLQGELTGYVRLVRPEAGQLFPFQIHCTSLLPGVILGDPAEAAEVSRLMVHANYRRRRGDQLTGVNTRTDAPPHAEDLRNSSPQILLSLYRQIYYFSRINQIKYWYAAMEHDLACVLNQLNFEFVQIGQKANYFGPVAPYRANLHVTEDLVGKNNPALLVWMQQLENNPA